MTAAAGRRRAALAVSVPECEPWLALYDEARAALDDAGWAAAVPPPADTAPFIDGASFTVDGSAVTRLVRALLRRAGGSLATDAQATGFVEAAIAGGESGFDGIAAEANVSPALAGAIGTLAAMPLLHACRTAWAPAIPDGWIDATCPICGAWAALVEARGLERRLRHRCGRCGADWDAEPVRCGFCGARDHGRLAALVPEHGGERRRVEACTACRGYLKTMTTLAATPPDEVALADLETVPLDVAAVAQGFRRPAPRPWRITLRVPARDRPARGRLAALLRARP
jgi:FdhE protein